MSNTKSQQQPIIIVRKKAGHGGHHGGAWKVAYADFVTAMMALFIVLWLMASSEKVKKAVADYFVDPQGTKNLSKGGTAIGSGESMAFSTQDLERLKKKIEASLEKIPEFKKMKDQITMTVTREGLRIELMENPKGVFFEMGKPQPTPLGLEILSALAQNLGSLSNPILVEGHTDAAPYQDVNAYSNWELSTDRAHAARRVLQGHGVRLNQIKEVRGFADQHLRNRNNPLDPSNRRISVIVQFQDFDEKAIPVSGGGKPLTAPEMAKAVAQSSSAQASSPRQTPTHEKASH